MSRHNTGNAAWDSTIDALVGHGTIATGLGSRYGRSESGARRLQSIVERLQAAPSSTDPLRYFRSSTRRP